MATWSVGGQRRARCDNLNLERANPVEAKITLSMAGPVHFFTTLVCDGSSGVGYIYTHHKAPTKKYKEETGVRC